jgi:hypothetical protein
MRIKSNPWSNTYSTMKAHSMSHHRGMYSTTVRSANSISLSAMGYTKRPSGSVSTMTGWCQASTLPRDLTSNLISSISMQPPTLASTHLSNLCRHGSITYLPALEGTSRSSSKQWPTWTIGGWQERLLITASLRTTQPPSQSKSINTSRTLTQHGPAWPHASRSSCLPVPQSGLKHSTIYRASQELYVQGGGGAPGEHTACTCVYP